MRAVLAMRSMFDTCGNCYIIAMPQRKGNSNCMSVVEFEFFALSENTTREGITAICDCTGGNLF